MGIFDSIAGALSNIFGGGSQQSNTAQTASSNNNRTSYGDNDYLAAGSSTHKQSTSKKSPGSTSIKETTTTQQPQQTSVSNTTISTTQPQAQPQVSQQDVVLPSINPAMNKLQQDSKRKQTDTQDKKQDTESQQDENQESESATKYQDILSQLPNPLEAIGSWINPEVAEAQAVPTTAVSDNREGLNKNTSGQTTSSNNNRSPYGDNDYLVQQDNSEQPTTDEHGHTIYKQGNKYGRNIADAYSAATTGDNRIGLDEAVSRDAYAQTKDERYNPDSDKYYLKHQGEKGYENINPYDIDGYEDFGEFYTGRHEDGSSWSKGETRRWIMQHPDVAPYIVNSAELRSAIESGTLDKAAFRDIADDYVNDMYDKGYTAADVQGTKKQAESSGNVGDFYNKYFSGNTVDATGLNEVLNNAFADYIATQMNSNGKYNTCSKAYDKWLNNLVTQGKYSDGNIAANDSDKDAYTYADAINAYNQAQAKGGADEKTTAMYNDAINKLASNMSLVDDLVMANTTNKNNMSLDTINNTVRKHYNEAGLYGDMDELTDLGDQYKTNTDAAQELANKNSWLEDAVGDYAAPIVGGAVPIMGITSALQKYFNNKTAQDSQKAVDAVNAAEDKGAALYDTYGNTSEGESGYSRAYDSGVDASTKQGINALYRALSNNGISQYNAAENDATINENAVKDYLNFAAQTVPASEEAAQETMQNIEIANKFLNDKSSLTDSERQKLAAATGATKHKAAYDINPILTSLMASGYAAPTDGTPSSLAYTFTPNNLKTAFSAADTEEQQS